MLRKEIPIYNERGRGFMAENAINEAVIKVKVIGVGGGGNSVLQRIAQEQLLNIELIGVNTDAKQLEKLKAFNIKTLQIGASLTKGLGTGSKHELGEIAAQKNEEQIKELFNGADLAFITAGMGGGTGTGAAPVIAAIAKKMGALTIGVVTMPFSFEGSRKKKIAQIGIEKLQEHIDALISVKNDNLLKLTGSQKLSLMDAFSAADSVLKQAIRCIVELIMTIGVINVDFADVKSIFQQSTSPDALIGIGEADSSPIIAVQQAVSSPLIEKSLEGARGIILNISGGNNLSLYEVNEATQYIYSHTHPDVNIIFGTVIDDTLGDTVRATIIATDFVGGVKAMNNDVPVHKAEALDVPPFISTGLKEKIAVFNRSKT